MHLVACLLLLFATSATFTQAALVQYPVNIGEKVVLDLGPYVKTWTRERNDRTEVISKCESGKCGWRDTATNKVTPSKDYVNEDGNLVIASYQETDAGQYGSPDEPMRINVFEGGYSALPRTAINVFTKKDE